MPSKANRDRKDITVHIGDLKGKLLDACNEDGRTPTDVIKELIRRWLKARARQHQRDAAEDKESKVS